jgi:hypothetical protein
VTAVALHKPQAPVAVGPEPSGAAVVAPLVVSEQPRRAPDVVAKAHDLVTEYNSNEIRADATYKGKLVGIVGRVEDVKKDAFGRAYVTITSHEELVDRISLPTVHCELKRSEEPKAAELVPGQLAAFGGTVSGMVLNIITVKDCYVKGVAEAGVTP